MWTYNGAIPGPLIRAKVGERVIVHFKNELPEPTTLHWHGVRVPNAMDGVPDVTQLAVEQDQMFTYDFVVPDAALFWYHPHVNSAKQVGDGLYGPLLVADPTEPWLGDEVVLVLSDASVNQNGELAPADESGDFGTMFGREGIGGDGGLLEQPIDSDTIVLAPAERADVVLVPQGDIGSEVPVRWVAFDRGFGTTVGRPDEDIFYLHFVDTPQLPAETLPSTARVIEPLVTRGAAEVKLDLMQVSSAPLQLGINGVPAAQAAPLRAAAGQTQIWAITNDPKMQFAHPFHLHGFFFQPLDDEGQPVRPLEWKDTINVPVNSTRRFAVRFDERVGMWMFHCHILDHADAGMMGMLDLEGNQH
jgi:FtsP/CotA-like multicopper oxidase with cupredoxin domain